MPAKARQEKENENQRDDSRNANSQTARELCQAARNDAGIDVNVTSDLGVFSREACEWPRPPSSHPPEVQQQKLGSNCTMRPFGKCEPVHACGDACMFWACDSRADRRARVVEFAGMSNFSRSNSQPFFIVAVVMMAIAFGVGYMAGSGGVNLGPGLSPSGVPAASEDGISVNFSPRGGCTDRVVEEIGKAQQSIEMQAYSFTSQPIAEALIAAHHRGVKVTVVLDEKANDDPKGARKRRRCLPTRSPLTSTPGIPSPTTRSF